MKPHGAGGGPSSDVIRSLVAGGMTTMQVATHYGVSRGAAENWFRKAGLAPVSGERLSHKRFLPWEVSRDHLWDSVARALRAWSRESQGVELNPRERGQVNRLRDFLAETDRVVKYSWDEGFTLVPRDPTIDDPELPIRRPS